MKNKVPKLRFPEFSGEWEEKKLGDLVLINTGKKDTQNKIENGKYPFFVRSQIIERIDSYSFDGEAILTAGDGVGVGKVFHYINGKFDYHQRVYKLSDFKNISGKYLFEYFSSNFIKEVTKYTAKTSVDSVRMEMLTKMIIPITSLPEQEKIASFLSKVDESIEILEEEKELWEKYKKGMMQKIFSQKLRFKGENGNDYPKWEENLISDLFKISAGGDIKAENISEFKTDEFRFPVYANSDKNKGLFGYSNIYKQESECITVTGRGNLGIATARYNKFYPIVRLLVLRPQEKQNIKFFEEAINNTTFFIESTGVPQLTGPQISIYSLKYPSLPEQEKIANFLSSIDEKIELIEKELEGIKEFKKGLLQQMFV